MKTIQAIYRAIIMLGTLVVLGLAFAAYGPPAETLGPLIDRAYTYFDQTFAQLQASAASPGSTESSSLTMAPLAAESAPAGVAHWASTPPAAESANVASAATPSAMSAMLAELNSLGMGAHKLHRWGGGAELYRFECRVSCPGQAVLEQHFEAVAADPLAAVAAVVSQVRQQR